MGSGCGSVGKAVNGSNPVTGKLLRMFNYCQLYWKDKNKENEAGKGLFFKKLEPL